LPHRGLPPGVRAAAPAKYCGSIDRFARAHLYMMSPGLVARCAVCEHVLLRLVSAGQRVLLDARGGRRDRLSRAGSRLHRAHHRKSRSLALRRGRSRLGAFDAASLSILMFAVSVAGAYPVARRSGPSRGRRGLLIAHALLLLVVLTLTLQRRGDPPSVVLAMAMGARLDAPAHPSLPRLSSRGRLRGGGEGTTRLVPLPPPTDAEVERMAATVARRILATLRARGVLEQRGAPEEAFELLQLQGVQVPPPGRRAPGVPLAAVPSLRASRCTPTPGFTRTTSSASSASAPTAPAGPCRSTGSRPCTTDGSPTG